MAAVRDTQRALKAQLRAAHANDDDEGCWASLHVPNGPSGTLCKLVAVNGSYYAFLDFDRHWRTLKATTYLVHEDEFVVRWVRSGPNSVGTPMNGEELEASFFMYRP